MKAGYDYQPQGNIPQEPYQRQGLGVEILPSLSSDTHISSVVKHVNQILVKVKIAFKYTDKEIFRLHLDGVQDPNLRCASPAWSPHLRRRIDLLQSKAGRQK